LTNQFQKLKTTSSFKKKLDAACRTKLSYQKFIAKNAAGLRFSQLFDFRVVRFFTQQGCAKDGRIRDALKLNQFTRQFANREPGASGWTEGLSKFSEHFCS
jgi:hypothetical protein